MTDTSLPMVSPERTYALVVGVETYGVDTVWDLPGAARDALRFAGWLTGPAAVPPANLRLFLSPLQSADLDWTGSLTQLRDQCELATESAIKKALLTDLPKCDGELLWIFWAGHGFLNKSTEELQLPYTDATAGQVLNLNLDSALRYWRSSRVPANRFTRQAVLVDTCRVDAPSGKLLSFPTTTYDPDGSTTVEGRQQFQLYAASLGEAAKNQAASQTGQLTEVLLDLLDDRPLDQVVRELDSIAGLVQKRFAVLREQKLAWQHPVVITRYQGWDGSVRINDWPETPLAPKLDDRGWAELERLFRSRGLPPHSWDAYRWAFECTRCAPPSSLTLLADDVFEVLRDLDDRQGARSGVPLVVPFVQYLAVRVHTSDPKRSKALAQWVKRTRDRMSIPALRQPPEPTGPGTLHVRLTESAEAKDRFLAEMWFHQDAFESIWQAEKALDLPSIREQLITRLRLLVERLNSPPAKPPTRIEFHVPYALLDAGPAGNADFERWSVPSRGQGKSRQLGQLYEVVMRCIPEGRGPEETARLNRKWHWFEAQGGGQRPEAVRLLGDADLTDELAMQLFLEDPPACVLAEVSDSAALLDAVVEAGLPIAVWRRGGPPKAAAAGEGLRLALDPPPGAPDFDLHALPKRLRELRTQHGPAPGRAESWHYPLALLWDNPTCRPSPPPLS
ncbi:hypothetical protein P3T37_001678 [Kitasatospora sp. MAA4]|uniref:VMAP-C domain-containing protein n=1 Tax=Kitasatospora sp. MAA4 TaxID=3035093 RepID=UPI00247596E9|nr:caspase family protein [Kitasatospora sp. MAA4]MDH6132293.1 hypothetical protein [Kitasatospora sp. MAA4]